MMQKQFFPGVKKDVMWHGVSCSGNTAHSDVNSLKYSRNQWKGDERCHSSTHTWVVVLHSQHCEVNIDPWLCDSWGALAPENAGHSCSAICSSPSASPGSSTSGTCSWVGFSHNTPFATKKKTQFTFWTCCTRMIRKLAGPQGWQTSLPPPPRHPSSFWSQMQ